MDQNMVSFLVRLDHSKAFDTVDHDILCHKWINIFKPLTSAVELLRTYMYKGSQTVDYGEEVYHRFQFSALYYT